MNKSNLKNRLRSRANVLPAALLLCCVLFPILCQAAGKSYPILVLCYLEIYIIAVSGLDILFGYCGQISMGHAAFYAIGAYASGLLHNYFGIPVLLSMLLATAAATLLGALLAMPASRLTFHFLSLSTIAFGEIIYQIISHSPNNITGNFRGLFTDSVNLFGLRLDQPIRFVYFALACMLLFLLIKSFLVHSRVGRAFQAIRENTHAADGMGINVRRYKVLAFALSAMFVSFAGAMYIHLVGYASPDTFTQKQSVMFITMLLFGGTACLSGPIIGTSFVLLLTELLRSLQSYQMLIYGALMLVIIVLMPGGLHGACKELFATKRTAGKEKKRAKS